MDGDEVVMHDLLSAAIRTTVGKAHPVPTKRLVDFERVSIAAGSSAVVSFKIPNEKFALMMADGSTRLYIGNHELQFSRGNGVDATVTVAL